MARIRFRWRVRTLMVAVAVSAVLLGVAALVWRARLRAHYLERYENYRMNEGSCRAALANGYDPKNAAYYRRAAELFARLKRQYRYAAEHPWSAAPAEE
jgi:hypothetical protein